MMEQGVIYPIIEQIAQLTPGQRRQLLRRLRVSGLLVPEELLTDKSPLEVATSVRGYRQADAAIGVNTKQKTFVKPGESSAQTTSTAVIAKPQPQAPPLPAPAANHTKPQTPIHPKAATTPTVSPASPASAPPAQAHPPAKSASPNAYQSPVSGKAVIHTASAPAVEQAHAMHPLPGQAPEQAIQIVFDGGSQGNPGKGYGSYQLRWPGSAPQVVRLHFGDHVTNNEAEYDTLIAALEAVLKKLTDLHADPSTARLDVRGDSLLVINQVLGKWQAKESRLQVRRDKAQALLKRIGQWRLVHHDRENSVRALGH